MNKLIVESFNDKYFISKLVDELNVNIEISEPLCNVDEYICLDGINNLKNKLKNIKLDEIDKLGLILDADDKGVKYRLNQVNDILSELNIDVQFEKNNELKKDEKLDIGVSCHILNIDGFGELENILKEIVLDDAIYADCLNSWKDCIENNGKTIREKDFLKFWLSNYIRFDTCSKNEQKRVSEKCNFEKAMQKDIWDFEHQVLDSLKEFLRLFSEEN